MLFIKAEAKELLLKTMEGCGFTRFKNGMEPVIYDSGKQHTFSFEKYDILINEVKPAYNSYGTVVFMHSSGLNRVSIQEASILLVLALFCERT